MKAAKHPRENERIDALRELHILDTANEEEFDELVEVASKICNAPISLITLVDADRQWFKAQMGLNLGQTDLQKSVCSHAILSDETLIINDTLLDSRTVDNPLVHNEVNLRFYAGVPLRLDNELPIGTLCVLDTTPRQLTADQQRALEVLGRQVMTRITLRKALHKERELKLQIEQQRNKLLHANNSLRKADENKNLFLAMLSHELRNPLSAINYGLAALEGNDGHAELQKTLPMMNRQCSHLTRLLDDLLEISRISRGTITLKRKIISLAPILDEAVHTLSKEALAKQIDISVANIDASYYVDADETRLLQVMVNLLHNAIRYTPSGGRVTIKATIEAEMANIVIEDTGQGISKQDLKKIFDFFVQLDNSARPMNNGQGLGLALVNELVSLHGGTVNVHSDGPGKGSVFKIQLPLATSTPTENRQSDAAPTAKSTKVLEVLITDDNQDVTRALGRVFKRRGHRVRLASSGAETLQAYREKTPDVIMIDIGLPDISGLEIARQLRRQHDNTALLLIASTGYGQAKDKALSKQAGFDHHLTKPFNIAQLTTIIDDFCNAPVSDDRAAD